jgi:insertion element IS1 protein InsB
MIGFRCRRCGSTDIRKNGRTATGHQNMHGKECDFYSTLDIQQSQANEHYRQVERLSLERLSQRAMARNTGLSRMTVAAILAPQPLPPIAQTLRPLAQRPILAIDERWSFVDNKGQECWIWSALERQTRRIVGLAFGDRSAETCRKLWDALPPDYRKRAICYTDFWAAYQVVLPSKRHHPVGKETGETAHIERFNNTLRQRCANLVRKALSFSKNVFLHQFRIRRFIDHYNRRIERFGVQPSV